MEPRFSRAVFKCVLFSVDTLTGECLLSLGENNSPISGVRRYSVCSGQVLGRVSSRPLFVYIYQVVKWSMGQRSDSHQTRPVLGRDVDRRDDRWQGKWMNEWIGGWTSPHWDHCSFLSLHLASTWHSAYLALRVVGGHGGKIWVRLREQRERRKGVPASGLMGAGKPAFSGFSVQGAAALGHFEHWCHKKWENPRKFSAQWGRATVPRAGAQWMSLPLSMYSITSLTPKRGGGEGKGHMCKQNSLDPTTAWTVTSFWNAGPLNWHSSLPQLQVLAQRLQPRVLPWPTYLNGNLLPDQKHPIPQSTCDF